MGNSRGGRRRAVRAAQIIAVAFVGVLAVACGGSERRLAGLKSDPMATYALPGAIDTRTTEMVGGTSGVSSPSMVRSTFTVSEGDAERAIDEIAKAATDAGWELTPRSPAGFNGLKMIGSIRVQIVIAGIIQNDTVWVELSSRTK